MTIAILGAGAIGQLIAHQLANANVAPQLLVKPDQATSSNDQTTPFVLEQQDQHQHQQHQFEVFSTGDYLTATILPDIQLLIVTLKAYQVVPAVSALLPKLSSKCHIVLLHNGIGSHLELQPQLDGLGLSLGTTSQGALRLGPRTVRHTGEGMSQFGHCCGPELSTELRELLLKAIPNSSWVEQIMPALWQKLAVNAVINPLTALNNVPNGALTAARYQPQIDAILSELQQVAWLEHIHLDADKLASTVRQVMVLTAENFSSMHQDVLHKRRTEIDYINGYLVKRAAAHKLALPVNQQLVSQINRLSPAAA
ncbi:2-dehydropantoate 2-reductase [Shewanella sp. A3A]|nr:2-dehydropantoate 2-reductase [Shewanella ferrihydritica]